MNNTIDNSELCDRQQFYTIIKIIILLTGLQISRIILKQGIFLFLPYNESNNIIISISIIFLLTLFIIYKANKEVIDLDIFLYMKNKESRNYYFVLTISILIMIFASLSFSTKPSIEAILHLIYTSIMIPIYEEIIFRSYIWNILLKENIDEIRVYFLTTILFVIYYIGYVDTIVMINGFNHTVLIVFIKSLLILSYGLFIGFFKYKIKNSYFCILIHSFINSIIT